MQRLENRGAILVVLAALLLVSCGGDDSSPAEVTGTSNCGPFEHDDNDAVFHECVHETSDDRVSGAVMSVYEYLGDVAWTGTTTITNDAGSWTGQFFGTTPNGSDFSVETELVGEGGYEGLTYTYTVTGTFGAGGTSETTGEGVAELRGVIAPTQ